MSVNTEHTTGMSGSTTATLMLAVFTVSVGFGVTMLVFSFAESLTTVYAERFLSGMFAAAVVPVAAAVAGSLTTTEQGRARWLAFVSMASIVGFMLGPMLGVFIARFAKDFFTLAMPAGSIAIPLAAAALLALFRDLCSRVCRTDWRRPRLVG